jgi:hypothetical protein
MAGGGKQTTTSNSEPWKGAQPALNQSVKGAQDLYKAGIGGQVYSGSTVVPWSNQTTQAMGNIQNTANANTGGAGLSGQYQNVINQGGMNNAMQGALQGYDRTAAAGGYNAAMQDAQRGYSRIQDNPFNSVQNNAINNTRALANSQYSVSPELQKVLDQTGAQVANQVNLGASAAGRYGGGLHQGAVAKNVGEIANNAILSDYQNFQGRRDAANSSLFNMGQTGINNQMGANSAIGNLGQGAMSNAMNANAGRAGIGQQAFGNLGTAYTGMQAPNTDLMNVGAMNEDLATRLKNDELRVFNESQNKPWELLGRMNAIASGAGQMGGTQTQTQPGQNPFLTALGYGASGAGLLGSFM